MSGERAHKSRWRWLRDAFPLLERFVTYGLIVATGSTALLGALVTYDFVGAAKRHPDMAAVYNWADQNVPSLFFWAFVISTALSILNAVIRKKAKALVKALDTERHRTALVTENLRVLFNGLLAGAFAKVRPDDPDAGFPSTFTMVTRLSRNAVGMRSTRVGGYGPACLSRQRRLCR